jgi:hypothetical protein
MVIAQVRMWFRGAAVNDPPSIRTRL